MSAGLLLVPLLPSLLGAQEGEGRRERPVQTPRSSPTIFRSTQLISLPTAETLAGGDWLFEVSHRFRHPVSEGQSAFWGLDGPASTRLSLGFAPSERVMVTAVRSNVQDNWDLQGKVALFTLDQGRVPFAVALQGGVGWSTEVEDRDASDSGNFQYYAQAILNGRFGERLALGVVPSYLYNTLLETEDPEQEFFWGVYGQLWITDALSIMGEWNVGENRPELGHDPASFGVELEAGKHFFKLFLSNATGLNPPQFLYGSPFPFEADELRVGFSITRRFSF